MLRQSIDNLLKSENQLKTQVLKQTDLIWDETEIVTLSGALTWENFIEAILRLSGAPTWEKYKEAILRFLKELQPVVFGGGVASLAISTLKIARGLE